MKILVTGSKGQLGSEIKELSSGYPDHKFFFTSRENLDISNKIALEEFVTSKKIEAIVNCAAYTAVDKAESQPQIIDKVNHLAVKELAEIAKKKNIQLVHISTDYVFNGNGYKPYSVDHSTDPINKYGKTKLAGETAMKLINPPNSIIVRTSWVYSSFGNNFVKTMLRLGGEKNELNVISDQVGAPTYAADLAKTILEILPKIKNENVEILHYTNEGVCSWYDFAKAIFEIKGLTTKVNPIESSQYPTPALRPFYSVLNKASIKDTYHINIPYWKDSLKVCLKNI